ncbi:patatin-like phospholipase family protein [Jeotgalibacillus salarius]|uniref:Patatin family protein n=1 Tax=Jeotgalibacillus salarius TaxID=546023 RepID=A0A4Y8LD87_9BACL|nr:patatin-like phospholipase family protein [Jeotgalibacillus salarius]TFE00252.1 patatin family protein [Jeotgalibacillus salarius]
MNPKIGLALGSGGSRGFAHLGVLKVLERENIKVDYIAGSSMGSLVGALYSAGQSVYDMERLAATFRSKYFMDLTVPKMGFISGEKFRQFVKLFTHNKNIEELNIPLSIVATDLIKAEKFIFTEGPVDRAVRASTAIPGIFVPEKIDGKLLVDGGVIDRVPASVARNMGADIVIGVDVSQVKKNAEINTIYDVIIQSIDILQTEIVHLKMTGADILISPKVDQYSSKSFQFAEQIIQLGQEAAEAALPDILEEIERWKEHRNE